MPWIIFRQTLQIGVGRVDNRCLAGPRNSEVASVLGECHVERGKQLERIEFPYELPANDILERTESCDELRIALEFIVSYEACILRESVEVLLLTDEILTVVSDLDREIILESEFS